MSLTKAALLAQGRLAAIALCSLLLVACSGSPKKSSADHYQDTRYAQKHDAGPSAADDGFDVSELGDAVPRPHYGRYKTAPYSVRGKRYVPRKSPVGYVEEGVSSWYGSKFHGHKTANGEIYNMYEMSAAHKTLPLPAYVRVTNLANGRSIVVRVNDRGPFHEDRLIDLSFAAAKKLDFIGKGTARVRLEGIDVANYRPESKSPSMASVEKPVAPPELEPPVAAAVLATAKGGVDSTEKAKPALVEPAVGSQPRMYLQVAALSSKASAERLRTRLQGIVKDAVLIEANQQELSPMYRVRIGPLEDAGELERIKKQVDNAQLGLPHLVIQ